MTTMDVHIQIQTNSNNRKDIETAITRALSTCGVVTQVNDIRIWKTENLIIKEATK